MKGSWRKKRGCAGNETNQHNRGTNQYLLQQEHHKPPSHANRREHHDEMKAEFTENNSWNGCRGFVGRGIIWMRFYNRIDIASKHRCTRGSSYNKRRLF